MSKIRPFRNADLPALAEVWASHWSLVAPTPPVSAAMIEQAILAKTFFDSASLLVVEKEGKVCAWCHFIHPVVDEQQSNDKVVDLCAICCHVDRSDECDELLRSAESLMEASGVEQIRVGLVRDVACGYAGLPPIGHGYGIPDSDDRTTSLLSRWGYTPQQEVVKMATATSNYRAPVNRELLQLRRSTRVRRQTAVASNPRTASAMSHLDIERRILVDQRSGEDLASIDFWFSDPEALVMSGSNAILDLSAIHQRGRMSSAETYLAITSIQSLAELRVLSVEVSVDCSQTELIEQLTFLRFEQADHGHRWTKSLR